jgi:hypothetical protein
MKEPVPQVGSRIDAGDNPSPFNLVRMALARMVGV